MKEKASPAAPVIAPTVAPAVASATEPTVAPTIAPTVAPTTVAAALKASIDWVTCGALKCATLQVPLDYNKPEGTKITLGLNMKPASNQLQRVGSVLTNPGGPSGSGIALVEKKPDMLTGNAAAKYDLIGFDPRGLGRSTPLPCASAQTRSATTSRGYLTDMRANCVSRAPELTASMTTANVARDMDSIRASLSEEKLNYIGISYGTYLGLVYADLFPTRVGKFVIDSAVDPAKRAIDMQLGQFQQYEKNLAFFLSKCKAPECPFADADITGRYDRLLANIAKFPVIFRPYQITRTTVESLMISLPERPGGEVLLRKFLSELERGDASLIYELIKFTDDRLPDPSDLEEGIDSDAVYFAVACNEGFHPSTSPDYGNFVKTMTAAAPHFSSYAAGRGGEACAYWGTKSETRPTPKYTPSVPPMLFVGSLNDRVTPIEWTTTAAAGWPGSVLLKVLGYEHGAVPDNPCAKAAASAFIADGTLPVPNTTCG